MQVLGLDNMSIDDNLKEMLQKLLKILLYTI